MVLFTASLIKQAIQCLLFVVNLFLTTTFGQALRSSSLVNHFNGPVHCIYSPNCLLYTLYKSIYDFGPVHHKGSSIDILSQPVPGIDVEEQHDDSNLQI